MTIIFKKSKDGGFIGYIKELPGVCSFAETEDELKIRLKDALLTIYSYTIEYEKIKYDDYIFKDKL